MTQTVLLVDDSRFVRTIIKVHLVARKFAFAEASDGAEALALFEVTSPDLVIVDEDMPGMDGLAFIRHVRESKSDKARNTPIILLTGVEHEDLQAAALAAGATAFLRKPVSSAGLLEVVAELLPPVTGPLG
jgi:two-component system, chemotaxis family, chemotaxis protein CheY